MTKPVYKSLEISKHLTHEEYDAFTDVLNQYVDNGYEADEVDKRMVDWCKEHVPISYRRYQLANADAKERVEIELEELEEKLTKLKHFIDVNPVFAVLSIHSQSLLKEQAETMQNYVDILKERLEAWNK